MNQIQNIKIIMSKLNIWNPMYAANVACVKFQIHPSYTIIIT